MALALTALPAAAAADPGAAPPADCALQWRVTARLDAQPRRLDIEMAFDADGRTATTLRLPGGWAGVAEDGPAARLQPVNGAPLLRGVAHPAGGRVRLPWHWTPAADAGARGAVLTPTWLAFVGQQVLPLPDLPDDAMPPRACIGLAGLPPGGRWVSSHGGGSADLTWLRVADGPAPMATRVQQALFAGGALQVADTPLPGGAMLTAALPLPGGAPLTGEAAVAAVAASTSAASQASASASSSSAAAPGSMPAAASSPLPAPPPEPIDAPALAAAGVQALTALRRDWTDTAAAAPLLVLLLPLADGAPADATAGHRAVALQAPAALARPGPAFDGLLASALARAWVTDRFGPLAHARRGDEALRAWYSEGVADFLAHRALLRDGRWSADDYAAALNARVAPAAAAAPVARAGGLLDPTLAAARGEWLALRWHAALRTAGHPGLEALLARLVVPAASARREGPISAPLAVHRLQAALRPALGDAALADIRRHVDQGEPLDLRATSLGPCFSADDGGRAPVYRARPDALRDEACQGWLGRGPRAARAADAVPAHAVAAAAAAGRAARKGAGASATGPATRSAGKKGAKAAATSGAKSGGKASPKAGSAAGKPAASPAKSGGGGAGGSKPAKAPVHRH